AHFKTFKVFERNATFHTLTHFANVLFFTPNTRYFSLHNFLTCPQDTHGSLPPQLTCQNTAASRGTALGDLEGRQNACLANHPLNHFGFEQTVKGFFNVFDQTINDLVQADGNTFNLCASACALVHIYIKTKHNSVGSSCEHHVTLSYIASFSMQDFYGQTLLLFTQVLEFINDRLKRP